MVRHVYPEKKLVLLAYDYPERDCVCFMSTQIGVLCFTKI